MYLCRGFFARFIGIPPLWSPSFCHVTGYIHIYISQTLVTGFVILFFCLPLLLLYLMPFFVRVSVRGRIPGIF